MTDAFSQVAELPRVSQAVADARAAVDRLLGHRILRRKSAEVSAESALRGARASAALEGVELPLDVIRGGGVDEPVVQGSLRVSAEIGALSDTWRKAPRQALARLNMLAAADAVPSDVLGRPRIDDLEATDPLKLGSPPAPAEVAARLDGLSNLLTTSTKASALVVGSIVHAELLVLRPFGWGDGIVARAAQRLTFVDRGLDPKSLTSPEVGHLELADDYADALHAYLTGTPEGVARWIEHCSQAVAAAARDSLAICEALLRA